MKRLLVFSAWIAILGIGVFLQSGQAKYPIIIDTDCGFDDLRAILMFLADHQFEVLAITTSEGSLTPREGLRKVHSLLKTLHHEGIPAAAGRSLNIQPPPWRRYCQNIPWGEEISSPPAGSSSAVDLISLALGNERGKVWLVCLGSLTTASDFHSKHPETNGRIEGIIWYNDALAASRGFNYVTDREAAENMFKSGLRIDVVKAWEQGPSEFDSQFWEEFLKVESPYAGLLADSFRAGEMKNKGADHLILRDDLVPLFMLSPGMFASERNGLMTLNSLKDKAAGRAAQEMMITGLARQRDTESQVFAAFPDDPGLFAADLRPYVQGIIGAHGRSEWRAGVLANELHGHLGIYAVIGVKMGLRAREYFNVGVDDLAVLSFAGRKPPLSCLNDGLQASTGGTLGHGLITVSEEPASRPEAIFALKNRKIRISLKKETAEAVEAALINAIARYGNLTDSYWEDVRKQAIRFWLELDRHKIFVIENIEP